MGGGIENCILEKFEKHIKHLRGAIRDIGHRNLELRGGA